MPASQPDKPASQPASLLHTCNGGELGPFLEHVRKVRASWQQIRRISRTRVAIQQPHHQHFAYVFEEYVDFESQEICWEAVVQDNFILQQHRRISRTRVQTQVLTDLAYSQPSLFFE